MEVHTHSHTPRKKWTHYFWEFLMLFLAVTLGFFVENQREHYIENKREKQFIASLYNDIKSDTAQLAHIIHARTVKEQAADSLSWLMNSGSPENHRVRIYSYAVGISRTLPYRFVPSDGTMQQLKNSGAFRLIRNRRVADSIAKYDVSVRNFVENWKVEETLIDHYRTAAGNIFDALMFDQMLDADANIVKLPPGNAVLLPYSPRDFTEWNFRLYSLKTINKGNRRAARFLLQQAENLLVILKNEYHLK